MAKEEEGELSPLMGRKETTGVSRSQRNVGLIVALVAGAGLMATAFSRVVSQQSTNLSTGGLDALPSSLSLAIQNEYGNVVPGDGFYPWTLIAEPHKLSTFIVRESDDMLVEEGQTAEFHWHVVEDEYHSKGTSLEYKFTSVGKKEVHCARYVTDETGVQTQTHHLVEFVQVRYVKRELRSLTDDDRDAFLTALQKVYTVSVSEGQSTYGENFVSIETLIKAHLIAAGQKECDHWHDGAGIMVHHLSFTYKLELALQAVNPAVTIPYWEYTIDSVVLGSDWRTSKVFSDDWFGNSGDNLGDDHVLKVGRWGYTSIAKDADFAVTNAFGLLRSPWNVNPDAYLTRHHTVLSSSYMGGNLPSCSVVKNCFDSDSLALMNTCLNGATHGPLHVLIGGQWGVTEDELAQTVIGSAHLLLFKNLWRRGYTRCPTSESDISSGFTSCSCSADLIEQTGGAYKVLEDAQILSALYNQAPSLMSYDSDTGVYGFVDKTDDEADALFGSLLTTLCSSGNAGEMYTSAAPYDPTFWVIHTTAERLLQIRRLRSSSSDKFVDALGFDETWGYASIGADSDLTGVCDWSNVDTSDALSMPTCTTGTCSGHNADDTLPFDLSAASAKLSATTTNQEFYDFLNPTNEDIPYVYDTFKYEKCMEAGVQIGSSSMSILPPPTR